MGCRRRAPPFLWQPLIFLQSLQTVLIEVKLIINVAPLTYVYPDTIKTYLTLNHLLFGSYYVFLTQHQL